MRNFNIIFALLISLSLTSCLRNDDKPTFLISIETQESEKWDMLEFKVAEVFFCNEEETGQDGGSNLQMYQGQDLKFDLNENSKAVIADQTHWDMVMTSIEPDLFFVYVTDKDGNKIKTSTPANIPYDPCPNPIYQEIAATGIYEIELLLLTDESLTETETGVDFHPVYEISFTQK